MPSLTAIGHFLKDPQVWTANLKNKYTAIAVLINDNVSCVAQHWPCVYAFPAGFQNGDGI
ncbi:hypothetical protein [Oscillatoria acuminata]|uniref:Uncharacterized protein n=1 Tax=Oscillatoria acuminata PCC 6304 TaxID=56110 RepID=K9TC66_9CYAN|nr:hypothetical protein [Oscillatoria acuminata]AFY80130.1 hypothetical protein Oscil6304_0380 [Oscillatoria acuminata PCC 6304]